MTSASSDLQRRTIRQPRLPRWAVGATAAGLVALAVLLFAFTGFAGTVDFIVVATLLLVLGVPAASWAVEGRRKATDRLASSATLVALVLTVLPLIFVVGYVVKRGLEAFNWAFLTSEDTAGPLAAGGGIAQAVIGTLQQVLIASVIAVPIGLLVAIYITEYGSNKFSTAVRFLVDVMTGIPSIVAGLFVLAFWVLGAHQSASGFAGAIALTIIELPIIVRASEEMLRLVPGALREASYALGIAKWKTILRVIVPAASTGITTGIMLGIARVIGETAPVLLVVGNNSFINWNAFKGNQASLPVYIFQHAQSSSNYDVDRAWAAALTLILVVVILYVSARLLTRRNRLVGW